MSGRLRPVQITPEHPVDAFPPDAAALALPNGLIAVGGDLSPARLLAAYRRGIFPWYEEGQPILWWSPDPRLVLDPRKFHASRSLTRSRRRRGFEISCDVDFGAVMEACAAPRESRAGTWITPEMISAYRELHRLGHAHSIEIRLNNRLVGGLYGVALGQAFFGESMFSRERDASKVALAWLCEKLAPLPQSFIDCQIASEHLLRLGATRVRRAGFVRSLAVAITAAGPWPADLQRLA